MFDAKNKLVIENERSGDSSLELFIPVSEPDMLMIAIDDEDSWLGFYLSVNDAETLISNLTQWKESKKVQS